MLHARIAPANKDGAIDRDEHPVEISAYTARALGLRLALQVVEHREATKFYVEIERTPHPRGEQR